MATGIVLLAKKYSQNRYAAKPVSERSRNKVASVARRGFGGDAGASGRRVSRKTRRNAMSAASAMMNWKARSRQPWKSWQKMRAQ